MVWHGGDEVVRRAATVEAAKFGARQQGGGPRRRTTFGEPHPMRRDARRVPCAEGTEGSRSPPRLRQLPRQPSLFAWLTWDPI